MSPFFKARNDNYIAHHEIGRTKTSFFCKFYSQIIHLHVTNCGLSYNLSKQIQVIDAADRANEEKQRNALQLAKSALKSLNELSSFEK